MLTPRLRRTSGFTFIELLVTIAILMFILLAAYNIIDGSQRITAHQEEIAEMDAQARTAMDIMSSEIREAGLSPLGVDYSAMSPASPWVALPSSKTLGRALEIRADRDGNGKTSGTSPTPVPENEFIVYEWTGTPGGVGELTRRTDQDGDGVLDRTVVLSSNVKQVSSTTDVFECRTDAGARVSDSAKIPTTCKVVLIQYQVQSSKRDRVTRKFRTVTMRNHVVLRNILRIP